MTAPVESKLGLPQDRIDQARELAERIARPVNQFIERHTTVSVERATLRLAGADGANAEGVPVPNLVVDQVRDRLEDGALLPYVNALLRTGDTIEGLNQRIAQGFRVDELPLGDRGALERKAEELVESFATHVKARRAWRAACKERYAGKNHSPLLYVIVATGNIHEDVKQARAAVYQGADVVAVIRTTAQSLLDYVPYGATTEGFGGTYATQENFRIMRAALDEEMERHERYIHLTNYASGLCMPEIAAMGAMERLDMMLNDSIYGILFRDINMYRTFVDQKFSRMINSFGGIIINTGEDNYLTTSDAVEKAHTVLASQFLNERFARDAGLPPRLMGLGHAFEMDPSIPNGFLWELAQARMAREIFPEHPLKYMPPTKHMTGNIFMGHVQNAMFNFASMATEQGIHLLGMLTEAIHTPFMMDRALSLENARYVMNSMKDFASEIEFKKDGIIVSRAREVLDKTVDFLEVLERIGMMEALEQGLFAEVKRPRDMGKGLEGIQEKGPNYYNPFETWLANELGLTAN